MRRRFDVTVYVLTAIFLLGAASIWWQGIRPSPRLTPATDNPKSSVDVGLEGGSATASDGNRGEAPWIWVHVAGSVSEPGVYRLKEGQRVYEALELAGPLGDADLNALNLASLLRDSDKIYVPSKSETASNTPGGGGYVGDTRPGGGNTAAMPRFPVNINTANAAELDWLPGIGPSLASAIITYRTDNGPFAEPEDIMKVSGIGEKTYAKFAHLIVIR